MKKTSLVLLGLLIATPAFANDYGEYAESYDDTESYTTYAPDYDDAPHATTIQKTDRARDTYAGFRIHKNEHIAFDYDIDNVGNTTIKNNNFGFGLNIGNRLTDNVKIEFETLYTGTSETKNSNKYDFDIWSNMLNVYIYKNFGGAVEPYFGVGVGFSGMWADINGARNDEFDLSFAAMAGVNFALNKYVDLNLGLRYVNYGKLEQENAKTKIDATEIYIGAAYKFGLFD